MEENDILLGGTILLAIILGLSIFGYLTPTPWFVWFLVGVFGIAYSILAIDAHPSSAHVFIMSGLLIINSTLCLLLSSAAIGNYVPPTYEFLDITRHSTEANFLVSLLSLILVIR